MGKFSAPPRYFLLTLTAVLLATPKPAQAYVDAGSGAMLWQLAVAAVIGSLFYVRRVFRWLRDRVGFRPMGIATSPVPDSVRADPKSAGAD